MKKVKVTWEEDGKKKSATKDLKQKKGGKGSTGESPLKIAKWMLKNLPTPTLQRLQDIREQEAVDVSLES